MLIQTDGLVIKESDIGETDRLITILTRERGVIRAFVRGARRIKSKSLSATQLFCYSRFTVYSGREKYIVNESDPIEVFFDLRSDIEKLSLAQYFAELCFELAPQEDEAESFLRLMLNTLHLVAKQKRPLLFLKAVFELRILTMAGYMPNLLACEHCCEFETDTMYFDAQTGNLYCENCPHQGVAEDLGIISAMRFIIYSDFEKLFSFKLSQDGVQRLSAVTEKYLLAQLERRFKTLDFFHSVLQIS